MKNCQFCGQKNPDEFQFCVKCGADMIHNRPNLSVWEKDSVKFALYSVCILIPIIGLILALLVSVTPFEGQKELSSKLITCACISMIVWFILGFIIGFVIGFSQSSTY